MPTMPLLRVQFEVFGKVQHVFFRKHTQETATGLGLVGWCANTAGGTVQGEIQGDAEAVQRMKHWLQHEGSPKSQITRAQFGADTSIEATTFSAFEIRR